MSTLAFRPALRTNARPLIGLYAPSKCGKTYGALLLARGFVGPQGKIGMIETEGGRSEAYVGLDPIGPYDVLSLGAPFSPASYRDALDAAEKAGIGALVIDSISHEWEGDGGVTWMAVENERHSGKPGLHCWKAPKTEHQRLVLRMLQTTIPLVVICMRAKYKSRQAKNERTGKTEIVKDDYTTPIQSDDFMFELMVAAEITREHKLGAANCNHPDLAKIFAPGSTITVETGRALAAYAQGSPQSFAPQTEAGGALAQAEGAAAMGTETLRAWFDRQPKGVKVAVKPDLDRLKAIAAEADTAVDDSFDDKPADTPAEEAA